MCRRRMLVFFAQAALAGSAGVFDSLKETVVRTARATDAAVEDIEDFSIT